MLLHNGNRFPSVPIGYSALVKESYETMNIFLELIKYEQYKWPICGDLKVISILLEMQPGYTKYCCFICEWDSRTRDLHYGKGLA